MNLMRARAVRVAWLAGLLLALSACNRSEPPPTTAGGAASAPQSAVTPPPGDSAASATGSGPAGGTAIGGMEAHPTESKSGATATPAPTAGDGSASAPLRP
ncbi:hypothetical protein [Rhizobacter sp. OV335]|uniref:hypothetical protein n=1 Tax=Rhizobacter sp. OV335 TaxID=1500264 RepID=UPI00091F0805|nr:hypothetical protein [Rhizobacter sp. OV335]SHN30651.1 hypothetical protein SAMN02787076_04971 [Rhizobacter sp. OV335]